LKKWRTLLDSCSSKGGTHWRKWCGDGSMCGCSQPNSAVLVPAKEFSFLYTQPSALSITNAALLLCSSHCTPASLTQQAFRAPPVPLLRPKWPAIQRVRGCCSGLGPLGHGGTDDLVSWGPAPLDIDPLLVLTPALERGLGGQ
jgi:hypothetical protein